MMRARTSAPKRLARRQPPNAGTVTITITIRMRSLRMPARWISSYHTRPQQVHGQGAHQAIPWVVTWFEDGGRNRRNCLPTWRLGEAPNGIGENRRKMGGQENAIAAAH